MRNTNKKGFTIVELVVVVAVIAILAAVLIPTFSGIIRRANISADTVVAKNLNNALAIEDAEKEIDDFYDVIDALTAHGYLITNINAKANECYFAWEKETNQIVLVDGKEDYKILYAANKNHGIIDDSWYFAINDNALAKKVQEKYPDANVFTSFETPDVTEISEPITTIKDSWYKKYEANSTTVATDDLYLELETNDVEITMMKIGENTYGASDTFKLSIGNNAFVEFNYFKVGADGKVSIASPIAAFDAKAKYGVLGGTLVMNTGDKAENLLTVKDAYIRVDGTSTKATQNSAGQYVLTVSTGSKNAMFAVEIDGVLTTDYAIRRSNTGYGYTDCSLSPVASGAGYGTYVGGFDHIYTAEDDGKIMVFDVYIAGKGYIQFELVLNVQ